MGQGGPRHRVWLGHRSGEGNAGGRGGLRSRGRRRRGLQTLLSLGARLGGLCHPQHRVGCLSLRRTSSRGRWERRQTGFVRGQYLREQGEKKGRADDH